MTDAAWQPWETPQKILVILAHPDDPEFFCGATIARWTSLGHQVDYCLLTHGDKGSNDPNTNPLDLSRLRENEQNAAASCLGVHSVQFLDYEDGSLVPTLDTRKVVCRVIRQQRPDVIVTCDPLNFYINDLHINHPDHRAAGTITLEAIFPAAGNPLYYPELMLEEGLLPHTVRETWLSLTAQPNLVFDVTDTWGQKIAALLQHRSQIGEKEAFLARMRTRRTPDSSDESPRYEERFRKLVARV
jgi:LmbE family N-acetylglucosaminyl deacetylase